MADPLRTRPHPDGPPDVAADFAPDDFREAFGEDLLNTLDLATWRAGRDLSAEYRRVETEIAEAVECEGQQQRRVREHVFPRLAWAPAAPPGAGTYGPVSVADIA